MKLAIIILFIITTSSAVWSSDRRQCLTGSMTDVQSWISENGTLIKNAGYGEAIDVSSVANPVLMVQRAIASFKTSRSAVRYLSLAKCKLTAVPPVFNLTDTRDRSLSATIEYLSLYGNNFKGTILNHQYDISMNATDAVEIKTRDGFSKYGESQWSIGFKNVNFPHLKELDLRSSQIESLADELFQSMPKLQALYLSENKIAYISSNAFYGLQSLVHLDLSRNNFDSKLDIKMTFENVTAFRMLENLKSLDFSYTKLQSAAARIFKSLNIHFERLSICHTTLTKLPNYSFSDTSLKYLDVSGNPDIFQNSDVVRGTEKTLSVVYADGIHLNGLRVFENFSELEVLKISNNHLVYLAPKEVRSWKSIQILDLGHNRISSWFQNTMSLMSNLKLLSLKDNNINIISSIMMHDIKNVRYLALSGNFFVCNCYLRELYEIAYENEVLLAHMNFTDLENKQLLKPSMNLTSQPPKDSNYLFHTGIQDYNNGIMYRQQIHCDGNESLSSCEFHDIESTHSGNYLLLDYSDDNYSCLLAQQSEFETFAETESCQTINRDTQYQDVILASWNKLYLMILIPIMIIPLLIIGFMHKKIRYFCITVKNSAMLSLIGDTESIDDGAIYNYDVFVSYCNDDRWWVLDYLLPHVERDCNVSVCLHERDFQVGLSILENIVSCMDRSKSIMLIISQKFLRSQWCQFEMHLAQHRLLETRREDLILILLEDIPRRMRPNTLHYLMMTKTYIVWPKSPDEEKVFWKRISKCLVTRTMKQMENVSLA